MDKSKELAKLLGIKFHLFYKNELWDDIPMDIRPSKRYCRKVYPDFTTPENFTKLLDFIMGLGFIIKYTPLGAHRGNRIDLDYECFAGCSVREKPCLVEAFYYFCISEHRGKTGVLKGMELIGHKLTKIQQINWSYLLRKKVKDEQRD